MAQSETRQKGLKTGAIGVVSATVIGVASTAPAYSMAATLGLVAAVVGFSSPAIMLVAFFPMLFTAAAYYYLNRVDPDCGATFSWVTRAMGPNAGWLGGWGVVVADVVVMPSLAWVAAYYTYSLFGLDGLAGNPWALLALGAGFILAMTLICWLGIELSARTQFVLLAIEILILVGFSIWAIVKVYLDHPAGSTPLSWGWINPFDLSLTELSQGILIALFIYWGWDTAANVNEETRGARTASGLATILSTLVLVGTYVVVAFATTAYRGPRFLEDNPDDVLTGMVGGWPSKLMMIAVLTSAMASTQTTILPTARTTLSMAAHGAMPRALARISPKYLTPTWSTWWFGIASIAWWVILVAIDRSENILWDSITGLGFAIAFYYGITALAAPILFRKHLLKSWRSFLFVGVAPLVGAFTLGWVFVRSAIDYFYYSPETAYTPAWFAFGDFKGLGAPFVIGIGMLVLGIPLWLWARKAYPDFFSRKAEAPDSLTEMLPDEFRVTEEMTEVMEFPTPAVPKPRVPVDETREE
ncbi:MAG: APC family permease [Candidatus Velamenicoccus archaeovorus]